MKGDKIFAKMLFLDARTKIDDFDSLDESDQSENSRVYIVRYNGGACKISIETVWCIERYDRSKFLRKCRICRECRERNTDAVYDARAYYERQNIKMKNDINSEEKEIK